MKELKINAPEGYEIDKEKSTFENIVFKKKANVLPNSFIGLGGIEGYYVTEMCDVNYIKSTKFWNKSDRNVFKTKEQAEASLALAQLSQLRDVYRQGWEPNWKSPIYKYCVVFSDNNLIVNVCNSDSKFLSFQDKETAELFRNNFRNLIEQAKPLMS